MLFVCQPQAFAKFWGDKQRVLWYVMVFSGVVNCQFLMPKAVPLNYVLNAGAGNSHNPLRVGVEVLVLTTCFCSSFLYRCQGLLNLFHSCDHIFIGIRAP